MKKIGLVIVISFLILVGCSNEEKLPVAPDDTSTNTSTTQTTDTIDEKEEEGYVFENKDTIIAMNAEVAPILNSLGDAMDLFEAESCAFQGMERVYTYSGFELHTYEMDGIDYVSAIIFLDDSVSTKEGIYLYSSLEDVLEAYGEDYTQNLGLYVYEKGKSKLSFLIEDDEVVSIEYMAINDLLAQ